MNQLKYISIYIITCLLLLISACKSTKKVDDVESNLSIPSLYKSESDSINIADINWAKYFANPQLTALINEALNNNFDLKSSAQNILYQEAIYKFNKKTLLPNLNLLGNGAQRKFGLYTMDGAGNISTEMRPGEIVPIHLPDYNVALQSSWEIDVWGKLRNQKKASMMRFLSSKQAQNLLKTNLIYAVASNYYELLALDNELDLINETIDLQNNALEMAKIQKDAAIINELAVQQFEAQLLNSKALKYYTIQNITETENKLNFLLGRFPQSINRDKVLFNTSLPLNYAAGIPSHLLENRPDIKQAELELIACKADVKSAKAAFYPSLNITAMYGFQAYKTNLLFIHPESMAYTILGGITAPLINRNAIKQEFNKSKSKQLEALYNYQKSIINGFVEVYNESAKIKNLEEIALLKSKESSILNQSISTSTELFKTGKASYIEVLISQKNALDTRLTLIDIKKQQYFSVLNLYKALGGGWN
jgi:multidrug efflux system outer membrane protein